jgi:hypothetical protein
MPAQNMVDTEGKAIVIYREQLRVRNLRRWVDYADPWSVKRISLWIYLCET